MTTTDTLSDLFCICKRAKSSVKPPTKRGYLRNHIAAIFFSVLCVKAVGEGEFRMFRGALNESEDEKLLGLTDTSDLSDGDIKEMR